MQTQANLNAAIPPNSTPKSHPQPDSAGPSNKRPPEEDVEKLRMELESLRQKLGD